MRVTKSFTVNDSPKFKNQLLCWAQQFDQLAWLDSNEYEQKYSNFSVCLAADAFSELNTSFQGAFDKLQAYINSTNDWIFGYLGYDLKNDLEELSSENFDGLGFPDLYFFQPKRLITINGNRVEFNYLQDFKSEIDSDFESIINTAICEFNEPHRVKIKLRIHKDQYFEKVSTILDHIQRGDIYETNFCQEFYAENTTIDPLEIYSNLNDISNPPFACFLKCNNRFLMSASPERYLQKKGSTLVSQPIKGTAKRDPDPEKDSSLKQELQRSEKDRSENIMIVDLVRNDLARVSKRGTVKVEELCKIYTFDQVHQLISTIKSETDPNLELVDLLKASFPMGSMTGAPKISAMKIIEEQEETKRGLYSGAVGYISPGGDFDFNVVIRSILYNAADRYVSYSVGGAITAKSDPVAEYEECLIKAKAMRTVLEN